MDNKFHLRRDGLTLTLYTLDYTFQDIVQINTLTQEESDVIEAWVRESGIGRRLAWDMWSIKDEEAVTMFALKWGQ